MGKLPRGIDDDMLGKLGNHVGRRYKGENVIAMKPSPSSKPPTQSQLDQRLIFAMMVRLMKRCRLALDVGFKDDDKGLSPFNAALSYNLTRAVAGVSPNFTIDYTQVQFSQGILGVPASLQVATAAGAKLDLEWESILGAQGFSADDQIAVVVYNELRGNFVIVLNAALRSAEAYELQLPVDWATEEVQIWLFAVSANGKLVSNTAFVGEITVVA